MAAPCGLHSSNGNREIVGEVWQEQGDVVGSSSAARSLAGGRRKLPAQPGGGQRWKMAFQTISSLFLGSVVSIEGFNPFLFSLIRTGT